MFKNKKGRLVATTFAFALLSSMGSVASAWPSPPSPPAPPPPPPLPQLNVPAPPQLPVPIPQPPPLPTLPPRVCTSQCDVPMNERALVLVNIVAQGDRYKQLYQFMESGGSATTYANLRLQYSRIKELRGNDATAPNFVDSVTSFEKDNAVEAVDVIIILHGDKGGSSNRDNGSLLFADREYKVDQAEGSMPSLKALFADKRAERCSSARPGKERSLCVSRMSAKDRVVLNTACYGQTHLGGWQSIGFAAANGSKGVYADSMASYPAMLEAWAKGYSFGEAVDRGNNADPRRSYDTWARTAMGFDDVDSYRVTNGSRAITIWNKPR